MALATIVLLFPLSSAVGPGYHLLALPQLIVIAFVGVCLGWIAFDRMAAWQTPLPVMLGVAVVVTAGLWYASTLDALQRLGLGPGASSALALSFALGASIRGVTDDRRSAASLVALASAATWLAYDIPMLPYQPLRDIHLYLNAGATALDGASPYQIVPITSVAVLEKLPFVYPPFTIMLFEFLASLPEPLAIAIWEAGSIAAVVAGLWLVGIRGRWLVVLLAWPPWPWGSRSAMSPRSPSCCMSSGSGSGPPSFSVEPSRSSPRFPRCGSSASGGGASSRWGSASWRRWRSCRCRSSGFNRGSTGRPVSAHFRRAS